jgi:RNA-binding protein YhbY
MIKQKTLMKLGRKTISKSAIKQVFNLLKENNLIYIEISQKITYKTKYSKMYLVNPPMITQIKRECFKKECKK